jgi:Ni/Co efflux regulator RcnB
MTHKAKLIVPLALVIVVAVVAVSMADGGGDGGPGKSSGWTSYAPLTDRDRGPHPGFDADVMGVVRDVKEAAAKEAPEVAGPIISDSEQEGSITAAQADELRAAARGLAEGKSPRALAPTIELRDPDVGAVVSEAFQAMRRRAPEIASPIIEEAVQNGEITESQAAQIRDKIATRRHRGCRKGDRDRDVERQVPIDSSV